MFIHLELQHISHLVFEIARIRPQLFVEREKIGAVVFAFAIASSAKESERRIRSGIALSDQAL